MNIEWTSDRMGGPPIVVVGTVSLIGKPVRCFGLKMKCVSAISKLGYIVSLRTPNLAHRRNPAPIGYQPTGTSASIGLVLINNKPTRDGRLSNRKETIRVS